MLDLPCATLHGHFWAHRPRNPCEGTRMNIYLVRNPLGNPYWRIGPIQGWILLGSPAKCHSPLRSLRSNVHLFPAVDRWRLWFTDAHRTATLGSATPEHDILASTMPKRPTGHTVVTGIKPSYHEKIHSTIWGECFPEAELVSE